MSSHQHEIAAGARFEFGANWSRFLTHLNDRRIADAEASLKAMLGVGSLEGRTFLDIGSGSGLFSLAAHRLGARVTSFDYDPRSVACTTELRRRFAQRDDWRVETGSALDAEYVGSLGTFDVVYSWGVLHHTGDMSRGLANAAEAVRPGGLLFVAIYNDQRAVSRYWTAVKRWYVKSAAARPLIVAYHAPYLAGARWVARRLARKGAVERGMTIWYDMIDWLGGYPFEVAKPEQIFRFFRDRGFALREMVTCGGRMGCNEFVFERTGAEG